MLHGIVLYTVVWFEFLKKTCCPNRTALIFTGISCGTQGGLKHGTNLSFIQVSELNPFSLIGSSQVFSWMLQDPRPYQQLVKCKGHVVAISGLHPTWGKTYLNSPFPGSCGTGEGRNGEKCQPFPGWAGDSWFYLVVHPAGFKIKAIPYQKWFLGLYIPAQVGGGGPKIFSDTFLSNQVTLAGQSQQKGPHCRENDRFWYQHIPLDPWYIYQCVSFCSI